MKKIFDLRFFIGLKNFVKAHKIITFFIIIIAVFGGYKTYSLIIAGTIDVQYVTEVVSKKTIIVAVSGTGQVSASNQVDVKSKTSGNIVYLGVKNAQEVKAGTLIAQIDTRDAQKTVKDAEVSLSQVKLNLEKMEGLTTSDGTLRGSKEKNADELKKAYEDGFNTVVNTFLQLPDIMTGLQDMLFGNTISTSQWNIDYYSNAIEQYDNRTFQFKNDAFTVYNAARGAYNKNLYDYKAASRFSSTDKIEQLIDETYETTKLIAEAIKNSNNFIQLYKDIFVERNLKPLVIADTHLSQLSSYTGKTNSQLSSLLSIRNTIQSEKETSVTVAFDIADQQIKVTQAENTLSNAKEKLADCFVYAPFSGIVAKLNIEKGDEVSSGASIATFITKKKIAEISLNEVDAAKVKVGQKATMTFDAVSDLSISGEVSSVDTLGTVTQGVVNYAIQVSFDTQDDRVKPGMSVSVSIITDVKQDVLAVPNAAVKIEGDVYYVEILNSVVSSTVSTTQTNPITATPIQQVVKVGVANDDYTEIISGLKEGDNVVVSTSGSITKITNANSASSLLGGGKGSPRLGGF